MISAYAKPYVNFPCEERKARSIISDRRILPQNLAEEVRISPRRELSYPQNRILR